MTTITIHGPDERGMHRVAGSREGGPWPIAFGIRTFDERARAEAWAAKLASMSPGAGLVTERGRDDDGR